MLAAIQCIQLDAIHIDRISAESFDWIAYSGDNEVNPPDRLAFRGDFPRVSKVICFASVNGVEQEVTLLVVLGNKGGDLRHTT